jgi:UDP-glucose 4-epimerase
MKHFITGGAGFIGSHLVDRLIENGEVTVFDNLSSGKKEFVNENAEFVEGDVKQLKQLTKAMKDHDMVWHLSANPDVQRGTRETSLDLKENTIGTYNVLEAMRINAITNIAFSSSSTVYGEAKMPTPEHYGPLKPISLYGASKLACEGLITAFSDCFDFKSWIFRFANIIGPRLTHGVIYDFIAKLQGSPNVLDILGDGRQAKSYLHVEECVNGMIHGVDKGVPDIYNLGCEDVINVTRIADIVCKVMRLSPEYKYTGGDRGWKGDIPRAQLAVDKMRSLGWVAKRSSEQAVKETVESLVGKMKTQDEH